ncbi:TonB-dependent receptor [Terriglobus roseus]|uniref:Outer membrane receptor proteins, mostly Fe transport n=1 Tax=Terriglobus roseus TaxID=392734 RepID=A0A1G7KF96_9BACT|nr:TonB-dependent receptor [Terriglobus roseus]SDF35731.1 Outer membrane receptor proteins, mostly Fe transport [Terriglobus roseus]
MRMGRFALMLSLPVAAIAAGIPAVAQSTAGTVTGIVTDASGAAIPNATVLIANPVSGLNRTATSDTTGRYTFTNLPFNRYHIEVSATGFSSTTSDVQVRTGNATQLDLQLKVGAASQEITVESDDVLNTSAQQSTTIDRDLFTKLPLVSTSSPLSSLVTLSTPGIASDSNGLFHPLGEHADTTFAIDGQPISDQQSRVFGNQPSPNIIQSVNVINGIAPAEYGDKTSLVVETTTRSGLGLAKPTGTVGLSYGTFGSVTPSLAVGFGGKTVGDFLSIDGYRSGRYLDSPEYRPIHDVGNSINIFNRSDYHPTDADALQLNLSFSRSWFQQPNQYDQPNQDQRAKIISFNIAPSWTHTISPNSLITVSPYLRQDNFHYYPSNDVFNDTPVTLSQSRRLQNAGLRADYTLNKGIHTLKAGATLYHTFLTEGFGLGVTDATFNAPCVDADGNPVTDPSITSPTQCGVGNDYTANDSYAPGLAPYDLTRGGSIYRFHGHTDIKQEAVYFSDNIMWHDWNVQLGVRGDNYNGLSSRSKVEPRINVAYHVHPSGTVLRLGWGQFFLTPYNENLIVSSTTGVGGLQSTAGDQLKDVALKPASRNQYTAGFEQSFGRYLVVNGEYFWKYTDRDFDFDVVLNSPLAFPIQWQKSKIDGFGIKVTMPAYHGVSAYSVLGHTRSRFFGPEVGGVLSNDPTINTSSVFRIDHDQAFQQSTNLQYQYKHGPYFGLTWRYESGLVAGSVTDPETALGFTPDQQQQIQLTCGNVRATLANPITSCSPGQLYSPLVKIPAPGTENDDKNPPRIAPRTLFDGQLGWDNVLHKDRLKTNLSITATNLTNKTALYNFLSTFSGTHYVSPRTVTGQVSFNF